jgi:phospholipase/carboxylesterase
MSIFFRNIPKDYWIIAPRAPNKASINGYSWRASVQRGNWPTVEMFKPAADGLIELIGRWGETHDLDVSVFDAVGFSQGGALVCALGVLHGDRLKKMGVLAGFAPEGIHNLLKPGMLGGKKYFIAHGTLDETVPISMARRTVELLESAGAEIDYCESETGHRINAECLKSLRNFLVG